MAIFHLCVKYIVQNILLSFHQWTESVKLGSSVLLCPTCLVPYVFSCFTCLLPYVLRTSRVSSLRAPLPHLTCLVLHVPRALRAIVLYVSHLLQVSHALHTLIHLMFCSSRMSCLLSFGALAILSFFSSVDYSPSLRYLTSTKGTLLQ